MPKNWQNGFYLKTTDRTFFLMAKSLEDRNMWMAGYRYLIASTVTVQNIMRENSRVLDDKIKSRTKKIQQKHMPIKMREASSSVDSAQRKGLKRSNNMSQNSNLNQSQ